jgi:pyroglutamyl-peptidase
MSEPVILVSGFEPFDPPWGNSSGEAARALDGRVVAGARVAGIVLPVVYGEAGRALAAEVARVRPRAIVCLGMADAPLRVEEIAVDRADDARPDNRGVVRKGGLRAREREPESRASTLPLDAILETWRGLGIEAGRSASAGRFVCNDLFYDAMRAAEAHGIARAGFIHVPHPKRFRSGEIDQAGVNRAVEAAIGAIVESLDRI